MKAKRALRQHASPKLRQKTALYYAVAGIAVAAVVATGIFLYINLAESTDTLAAKTGNGYTSRKMTGRWDNAAVWNKSQSWMNNPPGNDVNTDYVDVYGYITTPGNLRIGGQTILTIYDTLWVSGNLTMTEGGSLIIEPAGVLIVNGNFITDGGAKTTNKGRSVVTGNLVASGGAYVTNNKDFYVYGSSTATGGTVFNGTQNAPAKSNLKSRPQLLIGDPQLYNFVTYGTPQPVSLLYFTAREQNKSVDISWATASETNNDFFTIERSADGKSFTAIGKLSGAGNSQSELVYSYSDNNPLPGKAYYRLKQTDYDGQYAYSRLLLLEPAQSARVNHIQLSSIAPNPFEATFQVNFELSNAGSVQLKIMNMQGRLLMTETLEGMAGHNQHAFTAGGSLASGIYFISLTQQQVSSQTLRIIKK